MIVSNFARSLCLLIALAWLPAASASAVSVTLNVRGLTSFVRTVARDDPGSVFETFNPVSTPFFDTSTVVDGAASSSSGYALTDGGFDITSFDHVRPPALNDWAQSLGDIFFSVDQDVDYEASGSYTVIDSDGRLISYQSQLIDLTSGMVLYESRQESRSTPNESFTLGGSGGDFGNTSSGSLTGMLIGGHDYYFFYDALIQALPTASTTVATASGFLSLNFVPEASTGVLVLFGIGVAAAQRRKSSSVE